MHHWSDRTAGLNEIARVLRPDGKALIWDLNAGFFLFHVHAPDPLEPVHGSELAVVRVNPWRWPWRLSLAERLELAPKRQRPGPGPGV
jgi:SAM-dependent methyltransferase